MKNLKYKATLNLLNKTRRDLLIRNSLLENHGDLVSSSIIIDFKKFFRD